MLTISFAVVMIMIVPESYCEHLVFITILAAFHRIERAYRMSIDQVDGGCWHLSHRLNQSDSGYVMLCTCYGNFSFRMLYWIFDLNHYVGSVSSSRAIK